MALPGEVIFRSRGPFWSAWAVENLSEPLVSVAPLFILHPPADIDPEFLAWTLGRPAAQRYFAAESLGTNIKMISKPVLAALPLAWPSLHTQRSITRYSDLATREAQLVKRHATLNLTLTNSRLDEAADLASTSPDRRTS
ncbi:hypothetical protein [Agreia bicolorata]|nr:hypothetical protein [Agreia bicolorata]